MKDIIEQKYQKYLKTMEIDETKMSLSERTAVKNAFIYAFCTCLDYLLEDLIKLPQAESNKVINSIKLEGANHFIKEMSKLFEGK